MINKNVNILVIGCGSIGQRHAKLLSQRKDTRIFVADPLEENISECRKNVRIEKSFSDYRDALNEKIDGAFICTPNNMHVSMALDCLNSGACVLIEKPAATSSDEAEKLLPYDNGPKKRIMIGYMNRFNEQLQEVKHMVDHGELGNIAYFNASVYTYATLLYAKTNYREEQNWSLIIDYTHEIDFARYLIGEADEVFAMADALGNQKHMARPNICEIMLRFKNRAIGTIHMDYIRDPEKRALEVIGDKGSIELYLSDGILRIYNNGIKGFREIRNPFIRDQLFIKQIDNFINMIFGEEEPKVNLADGIAAIKIAESAIMSCKENKPIKLE